MVLEIQPSSRSHAVQLNSGGDQLAAADVRAAQAIGQWQALSLRRRLERTPRDPADRFWREAAGFVTVRWPRLPWARRQVRAALRWEQAVADLDANVLTQRLVQMQEHFRRRHQHRDVLPQALALIREQARRELGLFAYPCQLLAACALQRQCMAQVATGEGKTLIAALAAVLLGWRGLGCHVISVNDYLADRDARQLRGFYAACGLSVAAIDGQMDPSARRRAYAADITYLTNKEACADFLRDQIALRGARDLTQLLLERYQGGGQALGQLVTRGRACAIVDEVDSILLDEAVTPLIIAGDVPNDESVQAFATARQLALSLQAGPDFTLEPRFRAVRLTRRGLRACVKAAAAHQGVLASPRRCEEMVAQALTAAHFYHRDQHYIVQEGQVVIVDEATGRQMPDRTWRDGLHQAVQAKEALEIQPPKATFARISFQRFFRGYRHLCGMSGTTWEARQEFQVIYGRATVRIPTHRPVQRRQEMPRIWPAATQRWQAVVERIAALQEKGVAVLVGTASVAASETLSGLLCDRGVAHQVLNAVRYQEEVAIIARAGQSKVVTIATNMAGRGTDIVPDAQVLAHGGLHVIATAMHASARLDRQLAGRAGRQGQPGCVMMYLAMDDELVTRYMPATLRGLIRPLIRGGKAPWLVRLALKLTQRRAAAMAFGQRRHVLRSDDWLEDHVGFAPQGY